MYACECVWVMPSTSMCLSFIATGLVANTSNIRFAGADGEELLIALDEQRIAVSSASACAAGRDQRSHVLTAMGLSQREAEDSMRFSMGRFSTDHDVDRCLEVLPQAVDRIRELRRR